MRMAILGVGLLALLGCGDDSPKRLTADDVVGTWYVSGEDVEARVVYGQDGSYVISFFVGEDAIAWEQGDYELSEDSIVYVSSAASRGCAEGQSGSYAIDGDPKRWTITLVRDDCAKRSEGSPFTHDHERS